MVAGACKARRARSGRSVDLPDRKLPSWRGRISGQDPARAASKDLHSPSRATRLYSKEEWEVETAGDTHSARQSGANGHATDPGADL